MRPGIFTLIFFTVGLVINSQGFKFEKTDEGILLSYHQSPCYFYQAKTKSIDSLYPRANYIHPLYNENGDTLTEDFPPDHLHQRGIFWSWHQLLVNDLKLADPWECKGIIWHVDTLRTKTKKNSATLCAEVSWQISANNAYKGKNVLKEKIKIDYVKYKEYTEINFDIKLLALAENLKIGGSEDDKGYGGFSTRLKLPDDIQVFSSDSKIKAQDKPIMAGGWIEYTGSFSSVNEKNTGVIIMCQPDKLPGFKGWIIREKESMQNPAFPGRKAIHVSTDVPLTFYNKIIIYNKRPSTKKINKIYNNFCRK